MPLFLHAQVARELDKLLLTSKKEKVEKNWFKKAAEAMDMEISDMDDDELADEALRIEARKKEEKRSGDTSGTSFSPLSPSCLPTSLV